MAFEDIDTPISDNILSGDAEPDASGEKKGEKPVADPVADPVEHVDPSAPEAGAEKPEAKAEREQVIPRARFDEINAKLHQERQENEELRAALAARQKPQERGAESVDVSALENEFYEAMMAGDQEKAVSIRSKINEEIFARAEAASTEKVTRNLSERDAKTAVDKVAAEVVSAYPFLDSQSPDANSDAIAEVVEWRDFYVAKGDSLSVALSKAAAKIAPSYSVAQDPDPAVVDTRKNAAIERNIKDAGTQAPAPVAGIGNRTTPPSPKIETQKDWESLTAAEREAILSGG